MVLVWERLHVLVPCWTSKIWSQPSWWELASNICHFFTGWYKLKSILAIKKDTVKGILWQRHWVSQKCAKWMVVYHPLPGLNPPMSVIRGCLLSRSQFTSAPKMKQNCPIKFVTQKTEVNAPSRNGWNTKLWLRWWFTPADTGAASQSRRACLLE